MSVLDEYLVDPKVSLLCQQQVGNALEIVLLKRDDVLFGQAVARRLGITHADLECLDMIFVRGRVTAGEIAAASANGPVARDVVIRVLAEQEGANVVSPSVVDGMLWNAKLEPNSYDPNAMAAISASAHAPVVIWGQVDQFTPYHFDRFVPATPAYVEMTINTWSATGGTKTATINKQGSKE